MKLLSRLLFLIAFVSFLFALSLLFQHYNPSRLRFDSLPVAQATAIKTLIPARLDIPSLDLTLPIFPATINHNTWETTDKGVSYLMTSVLPGEKGNSIIYGHNFTNILGTLPHMKPGENIIITFTNGKKRAFVVDKTAIVDPSDDSILKPSPQPHLTIYTCVGFLDSKRFVVKALPISS